MIHHDEHKRMNAKDYNLGQDTGIGYFVTGTKPNGATRFIPGSHLWDPEKPPSEDLAFYAELQPGDGANTRGKASE